MKEGQTQPGATVPTVLNYSEDENSIRVLVQLPPVPEEKKCFVIIDGIELETSAAIAKQNLIKGGSRARPKLIKTN